MIPVAMPAFFFPPKSMLAVPESMPWTPMMHSDMNTTSQPTTGVVRMPMSTPAPASMPA